MCNCIAEIFERKHDFLEAKLGIQIGGHAEIAHNGRFNSPVETVVERAEIAKRHYLEDGPNRDILVGVTKVADDVAPPMTVDDTVDLATQALTRFPRLAVRPAGIAAIVGKAPLPNVLEGRRVCISQHGFKRVIL